MRSWRLRRMLTWGLASLMALCAVTAPAQASEDAGMCKADRSRVQIPGNFPIKACFDGKSLYLLNDAQFPLTLTITGDNVGKVVLSSRGQAGASTLMAALHPSDFSLTPVINGPDVHAGIVPPDYHAKIDVGNSPVTVNVGLADAGQQKLYFMSEATWRYLPLAPGIEQGKAIAEFLMELAKVGDEYVACRHRNHGWGSVGCSLLLGRNVSFAVGRFAVNSFGGEMVKAVVSVFETENWARGAAGDLSSFHAGTPSFTIAAHNPPVSKPTIVGPPPVQSSSSSTGGTSGGQPPPQPTTTSVSASPQDVLATVQNKHLEGATGLVEDSTPSYLSSAMQPYCASNGCEVGGTDMWSGDTFIANCWDDGAFMTNQNLSIPDDDNNPNRYDTTRWLKGQSNGQVGYISFVYLAPNSRALNIPHC